ncbi:MAG TPA: amino acid racemase [Patescibacteria group bacterium]|nr:amino acid racemase [Gammaproteobacteria bacterium]HWA52501.1 amino acid racemase [Patescibacteria group bacterium]
MKKLGLIGGIGCKSTVLYYELITTQISHKLGQRQSGNIIIYSVNEYDVYTAAIENDWNTVAEILLHAYKNLENAGADFLIICSNTCHKVVDLINPQFKKPLIHILEPICQEITKNNYKKIALFGTKFILEEGFYLNYIHSHAHSIKQIIIPDKNRIDIVHNIISNELLLGIIKNESKSILISIWEELRKKGADCLILGCTELSLIISKTDLSSPILDSTSLHAKYAAELSIKNHEDDK